MARLTPETLTYEGIEEPVKIACPDGWQKAERAIIRLNVVSRDPRIGAVDFSRIIPREFTGYWYLYKQKYQYDVGKIEFKTQEIYRDYDFWKAEIVSQQMAQRVPVIEVTQPEENIEESLELALFLGEVLTGIAASLPDIVFIDNFIEIITNFFANLSSNDLTYLPTPYRPDTLYIDFPAGWATVDIEFIWFPFSPISFGSGAAEIPIENNIFPIFSLPSSRVTEPEQTSQAKAFEERAIENGFIPSSQLPQACQNIGYSNGSQFVSDAISGSGFTAERIRDRLLQSGAISQSDIDEILSANPNLSPLQVLQELARQGKLTTQELTKAISDLSSLIYIPPAGKKIIQAFIGRTRSPASNCVNSYLLTYVSVAAGGLVQAFTGYQGRDFPSASLINWQNVPYRPYPNVTLTSQVVLTQVLCGEVRYFRRVFGNGQFLGQFESHDSIESIVIVEP